MKNCFSEKVNKCNKYLYQTYEKKEDTNCQYQNERRGITTDPIDILKNIRKYYE